MKINKKRLYSTLPCLENSKACAYIDLDNLCENFKKLSSRIGSALPICVIKADAYGHGAGECAKALFGEGCTFFAVSSIEEAMDVRAALSTVEKKNNRANILILGYTPPSLAKYLYEYEITQTGISYDYCRELNEAAMSCGARVKIHIALDTGMNRVGFPAQNDADINDTIDNICLVSTYKNLDITGIFSHFSRADYPLYEEALPGSYTTLQAQRFKKVTSGLGDRGIDVGMCHICNSAGALHFFDYHYDAVRLGIALYGYAPSEHFDISLLPVLKLETVISHIHTLKAGDRLGYGGDYICGTDRLIATLPIGYADGYLRAYRESNVTIYTSDKAQSAPLVGRICMDQCMVDITDIEGVKVGDKVIMLGEDNKTLSNLAKKANSSEYEALCIISSRIPRIYTRGEVKL